MDQVTTLIKWQGTVTEQYAVPWAPGAHKPGPEFLVRCTLDKGEPGKGCTISHTWLVKVTYAHHDTDTIILQMCLWMSKNFPFHLLSVLLCFTFFSNSYHMTHTFNNMQYIDVQNSTTAYLSELRTYLLYSMPYQPKSVSSDCKCSIMLAG